MRHFALLMLCLCFAASTANAAVTVEERILQKGLFAKADCKPDSSDPGYDACRCDADIRYPEILNLPDAASQVALNANFKHAAEQAQCEGTPAKEAAKSADKKTQDGGASSVSHHYEMTFHSPSLLSLKFTDWAYTGGAHGNGSIEGVILDLEKGKVLAIEDIIAAKDMAAVNQVIYDTLSAKPEGEVFRDQIESRKGKFIDDGQCQGCTLLLKPEGLEVVFQTYEVASFAEGNLEVPIPAQYISYPAVMAALAQQKKTIAAEQK